MTLVAVPVASLAQFGRLLERLRADVLEQLWRHGVQPTPATRPWQIQ